MNLVTLPSASAMSVGYRLGFRLTLRPVASLPDLIASVNLSLANIRQPVAPEQPAQEPAVNPKRSVFPDYIIFEDGKRFKSLKRLSICIAGSAPMSTARNGA